MAQVGQIYKWLDNSGTAITHIGNGVGGAATERIATSTNTITYTATTATDPNAPGAGWNLGTAVAGDLVITSDGFVGVYVSGAGFVATVDRWINCKTGALGTPNGSTARILSGTTCLWQPNKTIIVRQIIIRNASGTHTLYAGDLAIDAFTVAAAGTARGIPLDIALKGPVALGASAGASTITFEIIPP